MIGRPAHSVLPSDWLYQSVLLSRPLPCMPLDKTYPTWGTRRVFKHFARLQVGSVKMRCLVPPTSGYPVENTRDLRKPLYATLTDTRERMFAIMFRRTIVADVVQGIIVGGLLASFTANRIIGFFTWQPERTHLQRRNRGHHPAEPELLK